MASTYDQSILQEFCRMPSEPLTSDFLIKVYKHLSQQKETGEISRGLPEPLAVPPLELTLLQEVIIRRKPPPHLVVTPPVVLQAPSRVVSLHPQANNGHLPFRRMSHTGPGVTHLGHVTAATTSRLTSLD